MADFSAAYESWRTAQARFGERGAAFMPLHGSMAERATISKAFRTALVEAT